MADLTQTAADVRATATAVRKVVTFGTAVQPGNWVYQATSDKKYYLAVTTNATTSDVAGMVLEYGEVDTRGSIATAGDVDTGATGSIGAPAFLSGNAGNMMETLPTSAQFTTILGGHTTASNFEIKIHALGVAVP